MFKTSITPFSTLVLYQYVVIPYSDYFRMRLALLEYDDEDESEWEDIPYESDIFALSGVKGRQRGVTGSVLQLVSQVGILDFLETVRQGSKSWLEENLTILARKLYY